MIAGIISGPVFRITLRQVTGPWWLAGILVLVALPVVIAGIQRGIGGGGEGYVEGVVGGLIVTVVLPLVTMVISTAVFGNELEDRTLGYLALRPVSRLQIVAPKFAVTLAVAVPLLVVGTLVSALTGLGWEWRTAVAIAVGMAAGAVAYSSIFMWAGLVTTRAKIFALVYVFVWEGLLSSFLGGIKYLSVRAYSLAVMREIDREGLRSLEGLSAEFPAAIAGLVIVTALFFLLAVRRLRHMEVP